MASTAVADVNAGRVAVTGPLDASNPAIVRMRELVDGHQYADGWSRCWEQGVTPWDLGEPTPAVVKLAQSGTLPAGSVLVPGCGGGYDAVALSGAGRFVVGLDVCDAAIQRAKQLAGADLRVSPPSAGHSGGGRVGKAQISPVYSLGLRGLPAGGVWERMAWSARRFVEAEILSGGGASRSATMDLPPPGCSQLLRAVLYSFPVPELVVRRLRLEGLDGEGDGDGFEDDDDDGRWRLFRAEFSRLPVRLGTLSDPRLLRRSGGGAPWYVFFVIGGLEDLQDLCRSSSPDVAFVNADFFTWAPPEPFHLIFDYTFFCALDPSFRPAWAARMHELLRPDGELITLMYLPQDQDSGPPYNTTVLDYEEVLKPLGFIIDSIEDNDVAVEPRKGLEKVARWKKVANGAGRTTSDMPTDDL